MAENDFNIGDIPGTPSHGTNESIQVKPIDYDADPHFSIDPDTRELDYVSEVDLSFIQRDHNSKRITFEIPRQIDFHDMSLCNKVRIHFINISAEDPNVRNQGVYEVTDLQPYVLDDKVVVCSWLVSQYATQYIGTLNFVVSFACINETTQQIEYSWNTAVYSDIPVREGYDNGEFVAIEYADVLEEWHQKLIDDTTSGVNDIVRNLNEALDVLDAKQLEIDGVINTDKNVTLTAISNAKEGALSDIESNKQNSVSSIETAKVDATNAIATERNSTLNLIAEHGGIKISGEEPADDRIGFWIQDASNGRTEVIEVLERSDIDAALNRLDAVENELENLGSESSVTAVNITDKGTSGEHGMYRVVFSEEYRQTDAYKKMEFDSSSCSVTLDTDIYIIEDDYSMQSSNFYYLPVAPDENGVCEFELTLSSDMTQWSLKWNLVEGIKVYKLVPLDLSNYYTKSEVDAKINNSGGIDVDLSNYYTKADIDAQMGDIDTALDHILEIQNGILGVSE